MVRTITFYRTDRDGCPVEAFLDSLDSKTAQKVAWVLKLIEELDIVPKQYFQKLPGTDDIWECRIQMGPMIYRILAFFDNGNIILTHGFIKKTQKTPRSEIERAERYKADYIARKGGKRT